MVTFTQILYSIMGYPERASNQKNKLFDEYYEEIYSSSNFDIDKSLDIFYKYKEIKKEYKNSSFSYNNQKMFYVIYLVYKKDYDVKSAIDSLELELKKKSNNKRPMLQPEFKKNFDIK